MLRFNSYKKKRVQYQKRNGKHNKKPGFPNGRKYRFDSFHPIKIQNLDLKMQ